MEDGKLIADASGNPALIIFTSNYTLAPTVGYGTAYRSARTDRPTFKNVAIRYADTAIAVTTAPIEISNVTITNVLTGVDIDKDTTLWT